MRKFRVLLLGLLIIFFVAACGDNNDNSKDANDTNNENEAPNTNEPANDSNEGEEVKLRMAWWGDQPRTDYTLEVIELFEAENPNIKIEAEYAGWDDYWQSLAPQAAANELPDIIQMDLSYISQYAENNQLADLTPFFDNEIDISNIDENIVSGGQVGDGIYGFNLGVNAVGFHYNPAMLDVIGVDSLPEDWTWDDYIELADQAADAGVFFDTGMQPDVFFNYYLRSHGERLYAEDGSGLGYENDQLFVDFFTMLYDRVEAESTPTPDFLAQISGYEDDPVVKEEGVGIWQWSNQFVGLQQVAGVPFEMAPMPGPNSSEGLFLKPSMFFSITENSDHKEAAAKFINFFVNDIEANKLILGDRGIPGSSEVKEALKTEVSEEQAKVFDYIDWAESNSTPMGAPDPSQAGEIISLLDGIVEQVMYGQTSPEDAAADFRSQAEGIFGQ